MSLEAYKERIHELPCVVQVGRYGVLLDEQDARRFSHTSIWIASHGYALIYWDGKDQYLHRVVMDAKNGEHVDHISGDKLDNRKDNLRTCSHSENMMNCRLRQDNTSGQKGVYWSMRDQVWRAQIAINGKTKGLGSFRDLDDAIAARKEAESTFYGEFAR